MKFLILFTLLVSSLFSSSELGWSHDYKKTLEQAKIENKLVYILITSDSCGWCRKFESTTLQEKAIQKRLYSEFEVVHLSRDRDVIPKEFKTSPVPRHYFVDAKGNILYATLGYRKADCFDSFMDNAENKLKINR